MTARSLLFVPGDRPDRFAKALNSGADQVVLDLEDAVLPAAKEAARETLATWLSGPEARPVLVRVNSAGTPWHEADLRVLAGRSRLAGIMLPKAETPAMLAPVRDALPAGAELIGLVETVRGVAQLRDLAGTPGLTRLAFGSVDFSVEMGMPGQGPELDPVRYQLVLESSLAGLAAPIEGVTIALKDPEALAADVARACRFGFGAKLCIHPNQVAAVNAGFSPGEAEIEWAERVIAAGRSGEGAVAVNGKLVDKPVILQAERILARRRDPGTQPA